MRPTPLAPNVVSNRIDRAGNTIANVTAILLDRLNTTTADQAWANKQVLEVLHSLQPGDRVALFTMGRLVRVIADFTADPERVRAAMARLGPEQSFDLAASDPTGQDGIMSDSDIPVIGDAEPDQGTQNAIATMNQFAMERRIELTAEAMQVMARHLAGFFGRKNLIWVSSSFPFTYEFRESDNALQRITPAVRALNDANVAIYPIDPRGLKTIPPPAAPTRAPSRTRQTAPQPQVGLSGIDTMNILAKETGGRTFYNSNDLTRGMRAALEDAQSTYILGFYPEEEELAEKFHDLNLKVDRKGVETHHRARYFAGNMVPLTAAQRRDALRNVFATPLEATGIGLSAVITPEKEEPAKSVVAIRIDLTDLQPEQQGDRWVVQVDLATLSSITKPAKLRIETFTLSFSADQLRHAMEEGYILIRPVETNGTAGALRLALQGRTTGAVGSVTLQLR